MNDREYFIRKVNESKAFIDCEPWIAEELHDRLKFRPPGFQFSPKFKKKVWDGWIKLFDRHKSTLPMGLVPKASTILKEIGARGSAETDVLKCFLNMNFKASEFDEWFSSLTVHDDRGERIEKLWAHQRDAVIKCLSRKRVAIVSPTSSGKSLQIYTVCRWILQHEEIHDSQFILVVVPTVMLANQLRQNFGEYSAFDDTFDVDKEVFTIHSDEGGSSYREKGDQRIVVATWQSLQNIPEAFRKRAMAVFHDECHNGKGKTIQEVIGSCTSANYRVGMTGTLDGTELHQLVVESLYGPVYDAASLRNLIDLGIVAEPIIVNTIMSYSKDDRAVLSKSNFSAEYKFATTNARRSKILGDIVKECEGLNVLILCRHKNHLKKVYEAIKKRLEDDPDRKVFMRSGDHGLEERDEARRYIETNIGCVLVATYGILSTGVSIRNLHVGIFGSPNRSRIATLQSIGRLLRTRADKDRAVIIDMIDDTTPIKKNGKRGKECYLMNQFLSRSKIYSKEGLDYTMKQIIVDRGLTEPLGIRDLYDRKQQQ